MDVADSFELAVHGREKHLHPPVFVEGFYSGVKVPVVAGNLTDLMECRRAVAHADVIVHMAAAVSVSASSSNPTRFVHNNDGATATLWEAILEAGKKPHVVNFSSMSVYGEGHSDMGVYEDWRCDPLNIYAQTKHQAERICVLMSRAHEVPLTNIRLFNAYGPGQSLGNAETGVVAIWMAQALQGKMPVVYEDGQQQRDFVYCTDIAYAVATIVRRRQKVPVSLENLDGLDFVGVHPVPDHDKMVEHVNIGSGVATPVIRVAESISLMTGAPLPIANNQKRFGDSRDCYPSIARANSWLNWHPSVTLVNGLRATYEWAKYAVPR